MEVLVIESKHVIISEHEANRITIETLNKMFGHSGIEKHKGSNWVYDWHDTHGSGLTDYIRKATEEDKALYNVICQLRKKPY